MKYFLERSVARFMAVGCSGKRYDSFEELTESKIGRSLALLSVGLGERSLSFTKLSFGILRSIV